MAAAVMVVETGRRLRIFPCAWHDVLFQKIRAKRFGDKPDDVVFLAVGISDDILPRIFQGGFLAVRVREGGDLLAVRLLEAKPAEEFAHSDGHDIGQGVLLGENLRVREEIGMARAEQRIAEGDGPYAAQRRHDGGTADLSADDVHFLPMKTGVAYGEADGVDDGDECEGGGQRGAV